MEIHYSYEDIEEYEDYQDPEGTMLARRQMLGLPPPIPLAEPWELGPPVLIRDEPSWPMTDQADRPVPTKRPGGVDFGEEDEVASLIAAEWYDDLEGLIPEVIEDHHGPGMTAADAVEDGWPGAPADRHDDLLAGEAERCSAMRLTDRAVRRKVAEVTVDRVGGPGPARSDVAGGPGCSRPGAGPLGPWASLNGSGGPVVGSASEAAVRPPARDPGIHG